ncbi:MAG: phospholipase D family protein, partial [Muribaculaceae bacterium]|nr:phospholipase D family protein [Muribaculaceae bacterium]
METVIIGQGYNLLENTSVAKELVALFDSGRYSSFTCLVAFASFGGVSALTDYVLKAKSEGMQIKVILGVDQKGTSKEALEEVLRWNVEVYIYHTRDFNIFHPKVY